MNITVYCASSLGHDPDFAQETRKLGAWIGAHRHTLVYGGTNVGLMGLLSDVVLDAGGRVVGVLPDILADREPPSGRLTEFYRVETMAQRKAKMIELGDVFIALPGGPGMLEELSEIMSLVKLGTPPGYLFLLNVNGYYDELVASFERMLEHGFMTPEMRSYLKVAVSADELAAALSVMGRGSARP